MNIRLQGQCNALAGQFSIYANHGLKSTDEKQKRQMQCANEIRFWEDKKENLKNMGCSTLEEISRKLELFHTYEDEISAVKTAYNNEQMWHIMDEAKELGEKIAEQAEKQKAKTAEEREEERRKEALGIEEAEGALSEMLEETEELVEELAEELSEELTEELAKELVEEKIEKKIEENSDASEAELAKQQVRIQESEEIRITEEELRRYKRFDMRI